MYKVKIKKACGGTYKKMEEGGYSNEPLEPSNFMGPVPVEEANIEVEKGESAFGDINGDTFAELMFFGGKRHHSGGTPVSVPPGTFIFSDTAKLRIKDPEILEKFFNIKNPRKKGYTPAEISKQYKDFNKHIEEVKSGEGDDIKVTTSAVMVDNITNKLGALALIQESMKGFPDGIPSFAESVMGTLGLDPNELVQMMAQQEGTPVNEQMQQEQMMAQQQDPRGESMQVDMPQEQMMKKGGMYKYQTGGPIKNNPYGNLYKGEGVGGNEAGVANFQNLLKEEFEYDGKPINDRVVKGIWDTFLKAYEKPTDENTKEWDNISNKLDSPWSVGWFPGTDENQLVGLNAILNQRKRADDGVAENKKNAKISKIARDYMTQDLKIVNFLISNPNKDPSKKLSEAELIDLEYEKERIEKALKDERVGWKEGALDNYTPAGRNLTLGMSLLASDNFGPGSGMGGAGSMANASMLTKRLDKHWHQKYAKNTNYEKTLAERISRVNSYLGDDKIKQIDITSDGNDSSLYTAPSADNPGVDIHEIDDLNSLYTPEATSTSINTEPVETEEVDNDTPGVDTTGAAKYEIIVSDTIPDWATETANFKKGGKVKRVIKVKKYK
tara:strand:+ start:899 stop:2731 length:1833 start_codon:yes stop_codon:yes gene_type:complete